MQLEEIGRKLASEASPKWVRARVGGAFVVDSRRARLVRVDGRLRTYAVPREDVAEGALRETFAPRDHPSLGRVREASLRASGREETRAIAFLEGDLAAAAGLDGYALVQWGAMDAWYEEDEEVFVHPRDPHHRIDVLASGRHVVVEVAGERVAQSTRPILLFETGLPTRYYLPHADVRLDLLRGSDHETGCPYKGFASYHHVDAGGERQENLVWSYRFPNPEVQKIQGLLAFYNERVSLTVDGEPETSGAA